MTSPASISASTVQARAAHAGFKPFLTRPQGRQERTARLRCSADSSTDRSKSVRDQIVEKQGVEPASQRGDPKRRIDREDLYTDNWGGDKWKGDKVNVLSIIVVVSILGPVVGLVFAYLTFGKLWG